MKKEVGRPKVKDKKNIPVLIYFRDSFFKSKFKGDKRALLDFCKQAIKEKL
jgi:hypothetical protein